jgi:AcrR family transcriptional regulator
MTTEEKYLMRLELCSKKRVFRARMQEIADEAGINKAMLHYYFKTNNFFLKRVHECLQPIVAPNQCSFNSDASVLKKITKFTYDYITFVIDNPYYRRL